MLETHACLKRPINIQGGLYPCTGRMKDERITKPNWARMVHKLILIPAGSVRPLSSELRVILEHGYFEHDIKVRGLIFMTWPLSVKFKVKSGEGKEENLQCFSNILRR